LAPVANASTELATLVAKEKGAAETLAVAIALSPCLKGVITRAGSKLLREADGYSGPIDMANVALLILGRSGHRMALTCP
jgi:hypothetical protein